jgi:short-subunit dehydrogenase
MSNVIITGATKGIGRAIAEKLALQGCNLVICSRNEKELWATARQLKDSANINIVPIVADLSKLHDCKQLALQAIAKMRTIDVLINNAGSYTPGTIANEPDGTLQHMLDTNLYSAYNLTRAILPNMIAHKQGHIINMSSIAAMQAYPNGGSYSISKFALQGFSKNLREELKPHGIKVSTINPGATYSNSWAGSGIEPSRIMQANDIAEAVWMMISLSKQAVVEDIVLRPQLGDL